MATKTSTLFSNKNIHLENGINLWVESCGNPKHPAILLIMGAGAQCKSWPDEFCKNLSDHGFFVIRYDHRDTGKSSAIDYQTLPYTMMDLAKDAIAVLESFHIQSAHIVGFSMGGQIAQFIGAYFAKHAQSLILIGTSTSFKEGFNAFEGKSTKQGLSPPKNHYIKWAVRPINIDKQTFEEKIEDFLTSRQLLNGYKAPFDEKLAREIAIETYSRSQLHNPYPNHALAMQASFDDHAHALHLINTPTLIIHGTEDPIFGIDHAKSLKDHIQSSKLVIVETMGHHLNKCFFSEVIHHIKNHIGKKDS